MMEDHPKPITSSSTEPVKPVPFKQQKLERWKPYIKSWRDSGLSQSEFCKTENLNLPQFTYWKNKIQGNVGMGHKSSKSKSGYPAFVPVHSAGTHSEPGLRVNLPNGVIVSGITEHTVALLKAVIKAL